MPDFSIERHRAFIARRGESIRWWSGQPCTCLNQVTNQRDRNHNICGGTGYVYTTQSVSAYRALVRNVTEQMQFANYGKLMLGDITITTMPDEIPVREGDMVELSSRRMPREELIYASGADEDLLRWQDVVSLVRVVSGATVFVIGEDVGINDTDNGLEWLAGAPEKGTPVSVKYEWIPRYIVLPGMMTTRRVVGGKDMPQRVLARLRGLELNE